MQVNTASHYGTVTLSNGTQIAPDQGYQLSEHTYIGPVQTFYPDQVRIGNIGDMLIGGIAGGVTHQAMAHAMQNLKTNGFSWGGLKGLGSAGLKGGAIGAGLSAVSSAIENIGARSKGLITTRDAVSNIATDSIGGLLSGTTASVSAGAGNLALSSLGLGGLPLTIGASVAGAIGGIGASKLFDITGLRNRVFHGIRDMIS